MAFGAKEYYPGYQSHRNLVNFSLDALPALAGQSGPKFVFAHIVTPHPPFVFGPTGEPIEQTFRYSFMDGDAYQGTTEQYLQGYRDQLQYINTRMQEVIRSILEQSARPPVIIIQGDHGPGSGLDYNSFENTDLEERLSILNAYYLPDGADESLFEQISPVNSFRIIFNHFFNTELAILPDRSYYSTWSEPFNFIEVSDLSE